MKKTPERSPKSGWQMKEWCPISTEVLFAPQKLKNGEAVGADQIPVEVRKCLEGEGVDVLYDLYMLMHQKRYLRNGEKAY